MTTNIHDIQRKRLVVDSRWSVDARKLSRQKIIFVDDAEYEKIVPIGPRIAMFAGAASAIREWKAALTIATLAMPNSFKFRSLPTKGIALLILDRNTGGVLAQLKHNVLLGEATFAGTGTKHARELWPEYKDARRVVLEVTRLDPFTGGDIRHFDYQTSSGVLGKDGPYDGHLRAYMERGKVMYIDEAKIMSVQEAAASDASVHEVLNNIQSGALQSAAPFDGMDEDISDEEKDQLFSTLEKMFS